MAKDQEVFGLQISQFQISKCYNLPPDTTVANFRTLNIFGDNPVKSEQLQYRAAQRNVPVDKNDSSANKP